MQSLTFLKLGGAVFTNKEVPNQLRTDVLQRLVQEIAQAKKENPELLLVLGNGAGSFAHVPASHYKTMEGFINEESKIGMAITQDSAAQANRAVVAALIATDIPAVTVAPSNSIVTENRAAKSFYLDVLEQYLKFGLLPVVHGDVIVDAEQGCTVWSTDTVFSFLAREVSQRGWNVKEIIHVTEAEGVWKDSQRNIFEVITPDEQEEVKNAIVGTKGFDVTGGMWHKIEEALSLTKLGVQTRIMSGLKPGALYKQLTGLEKYGTVITHSKKTSEIEENYDRKTTSARRDHHGWQPTLGA